MGTLNLILVQPRQVESALAPKPTAWIVLTSRLAGQYGRAARGARNQADQPRVLAGPRRGDSQRLLSSSDPENPSGGSRPKSSKDAQDAHHGLGG
jgi:hypothetical protein